MTNAQLKQLLRLAVRYIRVQNDIARSMLPSANLSAKDRRVIAMDVAKTDIWLSKSRMGLARTKAPRKPK